MRITGVLASVLLVVLLAPGAAHADDREALYMVGDSITAGSGTTEPKKTGYPALLRNEGAAIHVVAKGSRCLVFDGCPGVSLVEKFQTRVLAQRPDEVVIAIGVNDLAHITDAQFHRAYLLICHQAKAAGVRVHIATITPTARSFAAYPRRWIEPQRQRVNRWIRHTWPNSHLDFAAALEGRGGAMRAVYDFGDGLHPNNKGAEALAEVVRQGLLDGNP